MPSNRAELASNWGWMFSKTYNFLNKIKIFLLKK